MAMTVTATKNIRVLIVGGGPTGLVSAICLAQNGIPLRIIDQLPGPQIGQRGAALQPRAIELFRILGVEKAFIREAVPIPPPFLGENVARLASGIMSHDWRPQPSPDIPYPCVQLLGQYRTEQILRSQLEHTYGIKVEYGVSLTSFKQVQDGVAACLTAGTNDKGETVEDLSVGWMIGADGPSSQIRKVTGLSYLGETRDYQTCVVGDVHVKRGLDRQYSHIWGSFSIEGIILMPSERRDDTLFSFLIGGSKMPLKDLLSDRSVILSYISNRTGWKGVEFGELVYIDTWRPNIRMANKFSEGRVFIAGDAAHIHCTSGGQGIVSCVQDAINLCWKLALVERGLSPPELLHTYNEERIPVITDMLPITTNTFDQLVSGKVASWPKSPLQLCQFGVNYRWSSIIVDDKPGIAQIDTYGAISGKPQAGDRAPEAPGLVDVRNSRTTSVFELLNSFQHTVLVFANTAEEVTPVIHLLKAMSPGIFQWATVLPPTHASNRTMGAIEGLVLADTDGYARRFYLPGDGRRIIVIRPDGIIGALTESYSGLQRYVELVFAQV